MLAAGSPRGDAFACVEECLLGGKESMKTEKRTRNLAQYMDEYSKASSDSEYYTGEYDFLPSQVY